LIADAKREAPAAVTRQRAPLRPRAAWGTSAGDISIERWWGKSALRFRGAWCPRRRVARHALSQSV